MSEYIVRWLNWRSRYVPCCYKRDWLSVLLYTYIASAPVCPNGGTYFRDRCYWAAEPSLPFNAAEEYCWEHFGPDTHITTSKDAEVNVSLSEDIYNCSWWLVRVDDHLFPYIYKTIVNMLWKITQGRAWACTRTEQFNTLSTTLPLLRDTPR